MYFGLYLIPRQRHQFEPLPYEVPCAGPSLLELLRALFRRLFH